MTDDTLVFNNQTYKSITPEEYKEFTISIGKRDYEDTIKQIIVLASRLKVLDKLDEVGMYSLAIYARLQIFRKLFDVFDGLRKECNMLNEGKTPNLLTTETIDKVGMIIDEYLWKNNNLFSTSVWSKFDNLDGHEDDFLKTTFIKEDITEFFQSRASSDLDYIRNLGVDLENFNIRHVLSLKISRNSYPNLIIRSYFIAYIRMIKLLLSNINEMLPSNGDKTYFQFYESLSVEYKTIVEIRLDKLKKELNKLPLAQKKIEVGREMETAKQSLIVSGALSYIVEACGDLEVDDEPDQIISKLLKEDGSFDEVTVGWIIKTYSGRMSTNQSSAVILYIETMKMLRLESKSTLEKEKLFSKSTKGRGNKAKELFTDTKGNKDEETSRCYAETVTAFLSFEKQALRKIPTSDHFTVIYLAEIYRYWMYNKVVNQSYININGYYRFLTDDCKLTFQTQSGQVTKKIKTLIEGRMNKDIYNKVGKNMKFIS